jgi:hypothetical protein
VSSAAIISNQRSKNIVRTGRKGTMLRRALDAAELGAKLQQQQTHEVQLAQDRSLSESESDLLVMGQESVNYGATKTTGDDDLIEEDEEESEDSVSYEDASYQSSEVSESQRNLFQRIWQAIRIGARLVADVDDLWDNPEENERRSPRSMFVVMFWFSLLAFAYAVERTTFKLLVDRTGPFRLFSVEVVTMSHALLVGLGMLLSAMYRRNFEMMPLGIPLVDIGCK